MNTKTLMAFIGVFAFCCTNIYILEVLIRGDPGIGNLVTFFQFLLFTIHGFVFTSNCGEVKRQIPIRKYVNFVLLSFFSTVLNNYAFAFKIPMPLHMIFRSGSLMANMVLGVFILEKKYTPLKYASIIMITVGIIICTIQTGAQIKERSKESYKIIDAVYTNATISEEEAVPKTENDMFWWSVGVTILTLALFLSARMGIYQEALYAKYGKHPWEALYYTHMMPLPLFILIAPNLWNHWVLTGDSPPFPFWTAIPSTRVYLLINSLTQCACVSCVYILTTECASLTVTLTVTLRKFVSLVFSILYFKNPFTLAHWLGTFLIFFGTSLFTEILQKSYAIIFAGKSKFGGKEETTPLTLPVTTGTSVK